MRNLILCTLLLGSQALFAGGEKPGVKVSESITTHKPFKGKPKVGEMVIVQKAKNYIYGEVTVDNGDGSYEIKIGDNKTQDYQISGIYMIPAEVKEVKDEAKGASYEALPNLGPDAEAALADIQKHHKEKYKNNITREAAYYLFLKSLPKFVHGELQQNKKRLAEHDEDVKNVQQDIGVKEGKLRFEQYQNLRAAHRELTPEQKAKICAELGISFEELEILEVNFRAFPHGWMKKHHYEKAKKAKAEKGKKEEGKKAKKEKESPEIDG